MALAKIVRDTLSIGLNLGITIGTTAIWVNLHKDWVTEKIVQHDLPKYVFNLATPDFEKFPFQYTATENANIIGRQRGGNSLELFAEDSSLAGGALNGLEKNGIGHKVEAYEPVKTLVHGSPTRPRGMDYALEITLGNKSYTLNFTRQCKKSTVDRMLGSWTGQQTYCILSADSEFYQFNESHITAGLRTFVTQFYDTKIIEGKSLPSWLNRSFGPRIFYVSSEGNEVGAFAANARFEDVENLGNGQTPFLANKAMGLQKYQIGIEGKQHLPLTFTGLTIINTHYDLQGIRAPQGIKKE